MGQKRSTEANPFHHRRPQPKYALPGIAGGEDQCQDTTVCFLWRRRRELQRARIDSPAGRNVAEGRGGGPKDSTINWLEYEKSKTQWQVIRNRLWCCSLSLLLLWIPLINRLGSATVNDGVEANKTIGQSNNQPRDMVEKEGDDCGVVLLGWSAPKIQQ